MPYTTLAGSPQDELLRISGSTGNPVQNISGAGTTYGPAAYVGADRLIQARLLIGGTVTGTNPTLDVTLEACSDAAGTGATTIATFAQKTATEAGAVGIAPAAPPVAAGILPASKPYLRAKFVAGGTTPVFNGVAVLLDPVLGGTP